ncbi:HNH endonuclease signature motif containing protein [Sphingobium baderi]|uniref:HNH endonuclease signature motif containing protein n=1 Tax=Sphingobium baderi TaxID=1332080 RepID=UPI002B40AAEA|nr:HNH endonuclease signature motif containing protein [Sphingobium baderi]WRD75833.1 HNH endonuclease signature motif containing protein [Sphingobium baderi]
MPKPTYDRPRPSIPAEVARIVEVEAGHCCAIKECSEHTYLEFHHIDGNRENNTPVNLITLCDKHHKMAHAGVIDRKALRLHKDRLSAVRDADILDRLTRLEAQIGDAESELPVTQASPERPTDISIQKFAASRSAAQAFALCQVAITRYEKDSGVYFQRHVEFVAGEKRLVLDGLKQFDDDRADIVVDFTYLRKAYLDAPAYGQWLAEKLEIYEVMTGRAAVGVLLVAVGRENMLEETAIPSIRQSARAAENITLKVYSCGQLGFHPGAVSAALF